LIINFHFKTFTLFSVLLFLNIFVVSALDILPPEIELNSSLPSNITTNIIISLSANFSDNENGFVGNITLNELSDESIARNLTFNTAGNQTVYLRVPKNTSVTNASVDLRGYSNTGGGFIFINQEDSNSTSVSGCDLYMNYSIPNDLPSSAQWVLGRNINGVQKLLKTIPNVCFDQSKLQLRINSDGEDSSTIHSVCNNGGVSSGDTWQPNWEIVDSVTGPFRGNPGGDSSVMFDGDYSTGCGAKDCWIHCGSGTQFTYSEEAINWKYYKPVDTSLEIGTSDGIDEWNYSGVFSTSETTSNFSSNINSYLSTCSEDTEGYCLVPINVSSLQGTIQISNIKITYEGNNSCEVCISSDGTCDTEWTSSNVTTNYSSNYLAGNCSYSWNTSNYADGIYNVSLRIKDTAYNKRLSSKRIILDRTAPSFTIYNLFSK